MALHLLNGDQNEHVAVHQVQGFIAEDVLGALNEAYALSKATQCRQFMYSLSLNPPQDERVSIEVFEDTLARVEKKLGLEGQPRVVVFHEKEGRRHAHVVWSRINIDEMKAINISHPKLKLNDISKSLYLEHGWKMPYGFKDKSRRNPLNYTRAEWQQAMRTGQNPKAIKAALQECWAISDSRKSFESELQENGYYLARGDRRGFVAVDVYGEVYSLSRQLAVKKKDLEQRLGKAENLPSVPETKGAVFRQVSKLFNRYTGELNAQHKQKMQPLLHAKQTMTAQHRSMRTKLDEFQKARWQKEENQRAAKIRRGFKGIWDKLNGRYWKTREKNEKESYNAYLRDQQQREDLINKQLTERQNLQTQLNLLRNNHEKERKHLIRDLSKITSAQKDNVKPHPEKDLTKERYATRSSHIQRNQNKDRCNPDIDIEPEV